jgi:hypothetical protein
MSTDDAARYLIAASERLNPEVARRIATDIDSAYIEALSQALSEVSGYSAQSGSKYGPKHQAEAARIQGVVDEARGLAAELADKMGHVAQSMLVMQANLMDDARVLSNPE